MRHLRFAQHLLANHRDQFVTRQQTVDRPDAGIARLAHFAVWIAPELIERGTR